MIVPWKHSVRRIVSLNARRGTTNRNKDMHQHHTTISTAQCICRRIQGTGNDQEVVTTFGSRWQHYPCGAVSSHGCPLECADVLFIERGRVLWLYKSLNRRNTPVHWSDKIGWLLAILQSVTLERLCYTIRMQHFWVASFGFVKKPSSDIFLSENQPVKYIFAYLYQ